MNSLKRETTIAKRRPDPFSFPATVCFRIFFSVSFSVTLCLCGEISSVLENWREIRTGHFPLNCAARFSRNAVVPSFLSSVAQQTPNSTASR
jgi:hypothetical protein